MDLTRTDEQEMLAETAAAFVARECPPERVRAIEATDDLHDRALWNALADLGWCALAVPSAQGGLDGDLLDVVVLAEQLGRGPLPSPLLVSTAFVTLPIAWFGSDEQHARLLPALVSGARIGTVALMEPGMSDPWEEPAIAGTGRLSGVKLVVPWAGVADIVIVATADGLWIVEPEPASVTVARHDAFAGDPLYAVTFEDAAAEPLGGRRAREPAALARSLDAMAVVHLAYAVGNAQRCLELSVAHASERVQFGRPIGAFQAVAHRCVEMRAEVDACRYLAYQAAWTIGRAAGRDATLPVTAALTYASDALRRVFLHAHQVHGAVGFSTEHDLHLFTRRLEAFLVTWAGAARHRDRLASKMGLE